MFCFHKYGEPVDGKQTCSKCNQIRIVLHDCRWGAVMNLKQRCLICGKVRKVDHEHIWEIFERWDEYNGYTNNRLGQVYVQKCKICGELKKTRSWGY